MTIEKVITQDKIEIVGDTIKRVQVRTKTSFVEDGVEVSNSYHRHVISPNDDLTNETDEVRALCEVIFTDEMKVAYSDMIQSSIEKEPVEEDAGEGKE